MFLFFNDNLLTLFPLLLVIYPTSLCGLPLDSNLETSQWALPPTAFLLGPLRWEPGVSKVPHLVGSLWCSCSDCQPAVVTGSVPAGWLLQRGSHPASRQCYDGPWGLVSGGPTPDAVLQATHILLSCLHLWNVATVNISLAGLSQGLGEMTHVRVLGQLAGLHTHTSCSVLRVFEHHHLSRPRGLIR